MASATVEGYLKAVYRLSQANEEHPITTGQLAHAMDVSPGTVTSMLKTLHDSGLASYTPYEGVRLTEVGKQSALRIFRRHQLLETYLSQSLGLSRETVHDDAERMQHEVSDFLIKQIDEYLGYPSFDPEVVQSHQKNEPASSAIESDELGSIPPTNHPLLHTTSFENTKSTPH